MLLSLVLSALGVLLKLISGLAVNKIVALNIGVEGFGYWGNILSLMALYSAFANGGIAQGMIARLAAPDQSDAERSSWLRAGLLYVLVFPVLIVLIHAVLRQTGLVSGATYLGLLPVYLLALAFAMSLHVQSAALAAGKARLNALILILGGLMSLTTFWVLIRQDSLSSAIRAQVTAAVCLCLVWLFAARLSGVRYLAVRVAGDTRAAVRALAPYVGIAIAPALVGTASVILIRQLIIADQGVAAGGLWQGLFRISDAVMAMAQAAVGFVMMPAVFRAERPRDALLAYLPKYLLALAGAAVLGGVVLHFFSAQIVVLLYSDAFSPLAGLLWVQFVGDVFKIAAMPLVMYFIYRRSLACSWGLEVVFASSFVLFVWLLVSPYAVAGAATAYVMANAVLLAAASLMFMKERA